MQAPVCCQPLKVKLLCNLSVLVRRLIAGTQPCQFTCNYSQFIQPPGPPQCPVLRLLSNYNYVSEVVMPPDWDLLSGRAGGIYVCVQKGGVYYVFRLSGVLAGGWNNPLKGDDCNYLHGNSPVRECECVCVSVFARACLCSNACAPQSLCGCLGSQTDTRCWRLCCTMQSAFEVTNCKVWENEN